MKNVSTNTLLWIILAIVSITFLGTIFTTKKGGSYSFAMPKLTMPTKGDTSTPKE